MIYITDTSQCDWKEFDKLFDIHSIDRNLSFQAGTELIKYARIDERDLVHHFSFNLTIKQLHDGRMITTTFTPALRVTSEPVEDVNAFIAKVSAVLIGLPNILVDSNK